jgi:hypothetical protein
LLKNNPPINIPRSEIEIPPLEGAGGGFLNKNHLSLKVKFAKNNPPINIPRSEIEIPPLEGVGGGFLNKNYLFFKRKNCNK